MEDGGEALILPIEFLNSRHPTGMPSHSVRLKVNAPIMMLRNLNPRAGLTNGTRLIVTKLMVIVKLIFFVYLFIQNNNKLSQPFDETYSIIFAI